MKIKCNRHLIIMINQHIRNSLLQIQYNLILKIQNWKIFQIVWIEYNKIIKLCNQNKFNRILCKDQIIKMVKHFNILWGLEQVLSIQGLQKWMLDYRFKKFRFHSNKYGHME
jgi:hypothetical protein